MIGRKWGWVINNRYEIGIDDKIIGRNNQAYVAHLRSAKTLNSTRYCIHGSTVE